MAEIHVPNDGINSAEDLEGGSFPVSGTYHVVVKEVDDTFQKAANQIKVRCEILAGVVAEGQKATAEAQVGKEFTEGFFLGTEYDAHKRLRRLALETGLCTAEQIATVPSFDFANAVGAQLIVKLVEKASKTDANKKFVNISGKQFWNAFSQDPEIAQVPRDKAALEIATNKPGTNGQGGGGTAGQGAKPAPTAPITGGAAAGAPAGDPFAAL